MRKLICHIAALAILVLGTVAAAGYVTAIYKDQGGDRMVVASGGEVAVQDGGSVSVASGGEIAMASGSNLDVAGTLTFTATTYAVLNARTAADDDGMLWYCLDCYAGSPGLAISNGTAYVRVDTGAAIATE